jgi:hypothetical protein
VKAAAAEMRDNRAEQLLLAAVMGIDGGLRDAGLAGDGVHRYGAEPGREKGALGRGQDRLALAGRFLVAPLGAWGAVHPLRRGPHAHGLLLAAHS